MDIVYVLGKGSLCNDAELRYSLRSLEKYCQDLGKIYIVGEKPEWLTNVIHIPYEQTHKRPWKNILEMVKTACLDDDLTDEFLLMNDDFFAFAPFLASELPYYAVKGGNAGASGHNDYGVHRPIRINKAFYASLPIDAKMSTDYSPRSFYGNFLKCPPTYCKDLIFRAGEGMPAFSDQLGDETWGSCDDVTMLDLDFVDFLNTEFPDTCAFENDVLESVTD